MSYDKKQLAELVLEAKGEGRSIRQYASDANVSPSVISRIIAGTYKPGIRTLQKLTSKDAKPKGDVSIVKLLIAAGFSPDTVAAGAALGIVSAMSFMNHLTVPAMMMGLFSGKDGEGVDERLEKQIFSDEEKKQVETEKQEQMRFKAFAWGIIAEKLTENEVCWLPGKKSEIKSDYEQPDFYVQIENGEIKQWWFSFWTKETAAEDMPTFLPRERIKLLLSRFILNPPNNAIKYSIVTDDVELIHYLDKIAGSVSFKGNLSIILIDTENICINSETTIATYEEGEGSIIAF